MSYKDNKLASLTNFYHLEVLYFTTVSHKPQHSAHLVKSVYARSPGIHVQQVQFVVRHYLQYMRVPADKKLWRISRYLCPYARTVFAGVAANVGYPYIDAFAGKTVVQRKLKARLAVVYVALHAA